MRENDLSKKAYNILKMQGCCKKEILKKNKINAGEFVFFMREHSYLIENRGIDYTDDNYKLFLNEEGEVAIANYEAKMKPLLYSKVAIIVSIVSICLSVLFRFV